MEIIVVGSGRVGAELAFRLFKKGHKVAVIDRVATAFTSISPDFRGRIIEGDVLSEDVLRRAGVESADGLAAVSNSDSLNAAVAHIAQTHYNVPNVVARNYDYRWRPLYDVFNIQVVSSASWGAQRIEELLYHREMRTVFSAGNGEVELYEFTVPPAWDGRTLEDLLPGQNCALAALTRAGRAALPHRETVLQHGDIVLVSATIEGIQSLRNRLQLDQQEGV